MPTRVVSAIEFLFVDFFKEMKILTFEQLYPFEEDRTLRTGDRSTAKLENVYILDPWLIRQHGKEKQQSKERET